MHLAPEDQGRAIPKMAVHKLPNFPSQTVLEVKLLSDQETVLSGFLVLPLGRAGMPNHLTSFIALEQS